MAMFKSYPHSGRKRIAKQATRLAAAILVLVASLLHSLPAAADSDVVQLELDGPLGTATAEYIISGIRQAQENDADLIIIRMDTPGGLMEPMRDIIQAILTSDVPVATFVAPDGARADSAGTYILLASHIAAMAPTTHLGAATPVSLGGDDPPALPGGTPGGGDENLDDESAPQDADDLETPDIRQQGSAMDRKVLNDAIAYIRSLAETHGRNADWAESAVRDAATLIAREALENNVIDVIANNVDELLAAIHGMEVTVNNESVAINSESPRIEVIVPTWRLRVLNIIANPQVILLLLAIGVYGLLFEGYNPGAIYPGVAGAISLLLAAYALQIFPVNYVGLALILVGFALIVAETMVPSFGALGLGGIIAFIFGSIMMFDSGIPGLGISKSFVIVFAVITGGLMFLLMRYIVRLRRRGAVSGVESIVGGIGIAMSDFATDGHVWLEGEAWSAVSNAPVTKDQHLRVVSMHGLTLEVEAVNKTEHSD